MTTLSLPFSLLVRPSVKGSLLETTRQPQAVPSGTLVLPVGSMASMASVIACLPATVVTSVSGVIGLVVQEKFGP